MNPDIDIDTFVLPASDNAQENVLNSGIDLQFSVMADCPEKEAAYEVLDFLLADENVQAYLDNQNACLLYTSDSKIALNYVSDFVKLGRLEDKIACMKEKGIKPVWFTPFRIAGREKLTTAEYLISAEQPVLKSIDWLNKLIYMKEYDRCV